MPRRMMTGVEVGLLDPCFGEVSGEVSIELMQPLEGEQIGNPNKRVVAVVS